MIDDADKDGSGSVDFQEFVEMMIKVKLRHAVCAPKSSLPYQTQYQRESEKETVAELKQAFTVLDKVPTQSSLTRYPHSLA